MTPKEKAKELVDKFRDYAYSYELVDELEDTEDWNAKQCALICVDEIVKILMNLRGEFMDLKNISYSKTESLEYWQEVKQEIEKL